jgi:hypothetical protein
MKVILTVWMLLAAAYCIGQVVVVIREFRTTKSRAGAAAWGLICLSIGLELIAEVFGFPGPILRLIGYLSSN